MAPPPGPPKRRSAPLAAVVVRFLATEPLVLGSFAAWGRIVSQNDFFLTNHLSRAASLPGAELFLKKCFFWGGQATCPGFAAWGRTFLFYQNMICFFLNKPLVPSNFAAWGRTVSSRKHFFEQATCPGQLRCLGQNFFSFF